MANRISKFPGNCILHSVSNDSYLCFYDDSRTSIIPNYIYDNAQVYSFDNMFCDTVKNDLIVSFVATTLTLRDLDRISRESNLSFYIETID